MKSAFSLPLQGAPSGVETFRVKMNAAIGDGHVSAAAVNALLNRAPSDEQITREVVMQAAALAQTSQLGEPGVRRILCLAQVGDDKLADDLIRKVAWANDVPLLTHLVSVWQDRPVLDNLKARALEAAACSDQWENYRYLTGVMSKEDLKKSMPTVLFHMVQFGWTPFDLVEQAVDWIPKGKDDTWLESFLCKAASAGCSTFMPLLLDGGRTLPPPIRLPMLCGRRPCVAMKMC